MAAPITKDGLMPHRTLVSLAVIAVIFLSACSPGAAPVAPTEVSAAPTAVITVAPTNTAAPSVAANDAASCAQSDVAGDVVTLKPH
jgi:hypothetical protein